jgi:hypothetical protein
MTAQEMADRILDLIAMRNDSTFAEIINVIGEEAKGDLTWEISPNTVLWTGMSRTLSDAFKIMHDKIVPHPTDFLVYLYDGAALQLPLAKTVPKTGYKKPHWLPVAFRFRNRAEQKDRVQKYIERGDREF